MSDIKESPNSEMTTEVAKELARQGEVKLAAMLAIASAADQRATTIAGMFGGGAIGITAAVLAVLVSGHTQVALVVGGLIVAVGLFLAAIAAAASGAPRSFHIAGGDPDTLRIWLWSNGKWRGERELMEASALRYAESININRRNLKHNSDLLKLSFWLAFSSPVIGVAVLLYIYFGTK